MKIYNSKKELAEAKIAKAGKSLKVKKLPNGNFQVIEALNFDKELEGPMKSTYDVLVEEYINNKMKERICEKLSVRDNWYWRNLFLRFDDIAKYTSGKELNIFELARIEAIAYVKIIFETKDKVSQKYFETIMDWVYSNNEIVPTRMFDDNSFEA